jgi:methionyl-tRNA formyltransferase
VRLLFAGTPQTALPSLRLLLESSHEVVAVLTRPDAPAGRGRTLRPSPVALAAEQAGLPVLKPRRLADPETLAALRSLNAELAVVVAYGALVPESALAIPPHGWVNLHFSILPSWRGAAPVQHAILHGDEVTGATTFRLEPDLDTGPIYGTVTEPIRPDDTAGDLLNRLARTGARLLLDTVDGIAAGVLAPRPQPTEGVSYAPKITPADARVSWSSPAFHVDRLIRAVTPEPGAWTTLAGRRIVLGPVRLAEPQHAPGATDDGSLGPNEIRVLAPGEIRVERDRVLVGTATTPVILGTVQPAGRRAMPAEAWARGARLAPGARFE